MERRYKVKRNRQEKKEALWRSYKAWERVERGERERGRGERGKEESSGHQGVGEREKQINSI